MNKSAARTALCVTAAVIEREGRIMVARRKRGGHLGGRWEFPGGKMETGETAEECLRRELFEEFGVTARIGERVAENTHDYGHVVVRLLAFRADLPSKDIVPVDHDEIRWVLSAELVTLDLAPADVPIARAIASEKVQSAECRVQSEKP